MAPPQELHEQEIDDDEETETFNGCGCFKLCCFQRRRRRDGENVETKYLLHEQGEETWVVRKLKEAKEASELLAGPKWKTFIRKFNGQTHNNKKNRFQYDPESYALNFDNGGGDVGEEDAGHWFAPSTVSHEQRRSGL